MVAGSAGPSCQPTSAAPWGAAYLDLLIVLSGVATGGADPEPHARRHPLLRGVDPGAVDAVLAALAGFWVGSAVRPGGPGRRMPRLRSVQLAYGRAALRWLLGRRSSARVSGSGRRG